MAKATVLGQTNRGYTPTNTKPNYSGLSATDMAAIYGEDFSHRQKPTTYVADTGAHTGQPLVSTQGVTSPTTDLQPPRTPPANNGGNGGGGGGGNGSAPASTGSAISHSDIPFDSGYVPTNDPAYMDALNALNNLTGNAPTYTPSYDDQLSELYNRIIGRGPFQYDLNQDPFYQQYRTQAIDTGRIAMADSMGQAAALTGGYGSSYGSQVGQQTYDAYLRQLNEQVPEFYNSAYNRWLNEGNQLEEQYNLTRGMANDEYNRYQDSLSDYYRQLDVAANRENQLYNRGYQQNVDANQARESNRDRLLQLMTTAGYQPSDSELEAAGMSPSEAAAWRNYYIASITPRSSGGGSGGGSSSDNVKLKFSEDQINGAIQAFQTGGINALDNFEMQLMLQGVDPAALDYLDSYIQGSYEGGIGAKGLSEEEQRRRTPVEPTNTSNGLTSSSSGDEVVQYYRRMGWIR